MQKLKYPRMGYVKEPTPLVYLPRFSKAIGNAEIYIKRDDLLPWGGNKARKLDFLFADAAAKGADTVITASTVQCNHNLMALLAANREGMKCRLILETWADPSYSLSNDRIRIAYELAGVEQAEITDQVPNGPAAKMPLAVQMTEELIKSGRKPYVISRGGSDPLGDSGYALCAGEIIDQAREMNISFDSLICPSGLGGTQAGLLAGFQMENYDLPVIGICIVSPNRQAKEEEVWQKAKDILHFHGLADTIPRERAVCSGDYVGNGYSRPSEEIIEAVRLLAQTEGILADPVYSGKTLAGLIGLVRSGAIKSGSRVVFLHTGGSTPFFNYSILENFLYQ